MIAIKETRTRGWHHAGRRSSRRWAKQRGARKPADALGEGLQASSEREGRFVNGKATVTDGPSPRPRK